MDRSYLILFPSISPQSWESIKRHARKYDVEEGSGPDFIFDVRESEDEDDYILFWGRDGWRMGYHHASIWFEEHNNNKLRVYISRNSVDGAMPLVAARKLIVATLKHQLDDEDPDT